MNRLRARIPDLVEDQSQAGGASAKGVAIPFTANDGHRYYAYFRFVSSDGWNTFYYRFEGISPIANDPLQGVKLILDSAAALNEARSVAAAKGSRLLRR